MAISALWKRGSLVLALLLACGAAAAAWNYDALIQWLTGTRRTATIMVSGNIEAHQSVLGFKTVQSRIVELPFDEGQWVKAGTLIARLDDSDYRQQVAITEAALEVQRRQLAAAEQNLAAAQKTVESDTADLELDQAEFRAPTCLMQKVPACRGARPGQCRAKKANAVIERDQALEAAAERQVELAKANIRNAEERSRSPRSCSITRSCGAVRRRHHGAPGRTRRNHGARHAGGDAGRSRSRLAARLHQRDRYRQGPPRQSATVTTDTYPGKKYRGRVSFISSNAEFTPKSVETHAERVTLVYRIRIDIDNPTHELVPGMPAERDLEALPPGRP